MKALFWVAASLGFGLAVVGAQAPSWGYSIPTIDLSRDTQRQVLVDREPGQYLGHPTTALLDDNRTMLVVYPKSHGRERSFTSVAPTAD